MTQSSEKKERLPIFRQRLNELMGNMSITNFAEKVGLSRQTMGFYLNGDRIPDAETLLRICDICSVSSDWLLGLSPVIPHNVVFEPMEKHWQDLKYATLHSLATAPLLKRITDFELCADTAELSKTLRCIDESGYSLIGVTQDASGTYTVFFRRPARG